MTTVQLVSLADGKCLTHRRDKGESDTYGWDTFRMETCVDGDARQMIKFGTDNLIKYRDSCFIVANRGDNCSSGQPDDFQVIQCHEFGYQCRKRDTFTFDGLGKGPFRIKNSASHTDRGYVNRDGILRHMPVNDTNNDSGWITLPEKRECDQFNIALNQCTPDKRDQAFCKVAGNMGSERCKTYCKTNDCDNAMIEYCAQRPDDLEYCGCLNVPAIHKRIGLDVKPNCHHKPCTTGQAYQTMRQRGDKVCPTVNVCDTKDISESEFKGELINSMNTTCVFPGADTRATPAPRSGDPSPELPASPETGAGSQVWIVLVVIIVLLVLSSSGALGLFFVLRN